ncbi:MAG: calcium-binding protein [Rhodobacteraceae bacterium]|nr:calcium-binding protein [Paracoccaceae bacterium]
MGKFLKSEGSVEEDDDEDLAQEEASADGSSPLDYVYPDEDLAEDGGTSVADEGEPADQAGSLANQVVTGEDATNPEVQPEDDWAGAAEDAAEDDDVLNFEVLTGVAGAAPTLISGFDAASDDPDTSPDQIFLMDQDGAMIPESEFTDGDRYLSLVDMEDGTGAALYLDDELVAVIEDYTAAELAADTSWVGNFQSDQSAYLDIFQDQAEEQPEAPGSAEVIAEEETAEDAEVVEAETPEEVAAEEEAPEEVVAESPEEAPEEEQAQAETPEDVAEETLAAAEGEDSLAGDAGTDEVAETPEVTTSLEVTGAEGTGQYVKDALFGANVIYTINTDMGQPLANIIKSMEELDIDHIRFPAGQGDGPAETEGEGWLNIVDLDYAEDGTVSLGEEVTRLLDWAKDPNGDGDTSDAVQVTLVIPTQHLSLEEYEEFGEEIEIFSQLVSEQYGDVVAAFEIGNEYWASIGETEYGAKANIAIKALAQGMENAGLEGDDQADIIAQMATPNHASEFHVSVAEGSWIERLEAANQTIIDQLDDEAREDLDGVVEHYYWRQDNEVYDDSLAEKNYITKDYDVWDANFEKELDLHITEWNVRTTSYHENGMKSASTILEQFENMVEMGVDSADVWAVNHNTATDLAGDRDGEVTTDEHGRVTSSVRGAVFDLMSSSLPGKELVEVELGNDDGSIEVNAYRDEDETVVYISSRSLDVETVEIDLSKLVGDFDSATGVKVGFDQSTADGMHWSTEEGRVEPDYVMINGEKYYYNEHDVLAEYTDYEFDSAVITVTLKPYEVIEVTFSGSTADLSAGDQASQVDGGQADDLILDAGPAEAPVEVPTQDTGAPNLDDHLTGSGYADYLKGFSGDDTIEGLGGDDTLAGSQGNDQLFGGAGDDHLNGGQQDDRVIGGSGDDEVLGWTGNDYLKGNEGNDSIYGGQGNDKLAGSQGNDHLEGGSGDDFLNGGMDDDWLSGGQGADTLTGWTGADTFSFAEGDVTEGDVITDFEPGVDVIELDLPELTSLGDLVFTARPEGGVRVQIPGHGELLLDGALTVEQVARAENFLFLGARAA